MTQLYHITFNSHINNETYILCFNSQSHTGIICIIKMSQLRMFVTKSPSIHTYVFTSVRLSVCLLLFFRARVYFFSFNFMNEQLLKMQQIKQLFSKIKLRNLFVLFLAKRKKICMYIHANMSKVTDHRASYNVTQHKCIYV